MNKLSQPTLTQFVRFGILLEELDTYQPEDYDNPRVLQIMDELDDITEDAFGIRVLDDPNLQVRLPEQFRWL